MLTAPGIPRRSPKQVLTRPDPAWLPRSDEIGRVQGGMAVSKDCRRRQALYTVNGKGGLFSQSAKMKRGLQHLVFPGGLPSKY